MVDDFWSFLDRVSSTAMGLQWLIGLAAKFLGSAKSPRKRRNLK